MIPTPSSTGDPARTENNLTHTPDRRLGEAPLSIALAGGASVVILLSLVRGLARGFVAISDDAQIALRSRDVFTEHHPLVGMASSGSVPGNEFNHPGPMLFDLLTVPVRLFGDSVGVAVGAALINLIAIWGIVLTARRVSGESAAVVMAAGVCALCWIMGSEVLYSVWNPNVVMLAFVWLCVAAWAVACGRWGYLPVAAFLGSLCAQSQLGYPIVVAAVLATALAVGWWRPLEPVPSTRRTRSMLLGSGVLLVCWAQPLWEQFRSEGRGNVSRTIAAGSETSAPVGFEFGLRILADALLPTSWFRPEFDTVFSFYTGNVPGVALSAVVVVIAASAGALAAVRARRHSPSTVRLLTIVAALFVGGMATLVRLPAQFGVAMSAYNIRWIWPGVVLLLVGLVLALWPANSSSWLRGRALGACTVGVLLLVLTVPTHGLATRRPYLDAVSEMRAQVSRNADLVVRQTPLRIRFDTLGWTLPYPYAVAAALDEQGVDIVVREPFMIRMYGPRREAERGDVATVWVQTGKSAQAVPPGAVRLAYVPDTPDGPLAVYADVG